MLPIPNEAVSLWLTKLYVSIIDPDRSREAFKRTDKFRDPAFLKKTTELSSAVDQLVFDASFAGDLKDVKAFITKAPQDVVDVLVFRFNLKRAELDNAQGELWFPDGKPDMLAALRLCLILDDKVRNGPWPTH